MLQVATTNETPKKLPTLREQELEAITAEVCRICQSYDPLPSRDDAEARNAERQSRIQHMLKMVQPDWPENPRIVPRINHNEWLRAVTNGVDRRS